MLYKPNALCNLISMLKRMQEIILRKHNNQDGEANLLGNIESQAASLSGDGAKVNVLL
jgi:hypothetical protein